MSLLPATTVKAKISFAMDSHEMGSNAINAMTVREQAEIFLNLQVTLTTKKKEYCELMKNAVLYAG